jgi:hypothetical protein
MIFRQLNEEAKSLLMDYLYYCHYRKRGMIRSIFLLSINLSRIIIRASLYSEPSSNAGIRSSKVARSVNPRWTNLILYGINGDTGTRPWEVKLRNKKTLIIFIFEQTA